MNINFSHHHAEAYLRRMPFLLNQIRTVGTVPTVIARKIF